MKRVLEAVNAFTLTGLGPQEKSLSWSPKIFFARSLSYFYGPFFKWGTVADFFADDVVEKINPSLKNSEYLDRTIKALSEHQKALNKRLLRLQLIGFSIFMLLFLNISGFPADFSIGMVKLPHIHKIREPLLLASTLLAAYTSVIYLHTEIVSKILARICEQVIKENERPLFNVHHRSSTALMVEIVDFVKSYGKEELGNTFFGARIRKSVILSAAGLGVVTLVMIPVLIAVHLFIIFDILLHPSQSLTISILVTIFVITVDCLTSTGATILYIVKTKHLDMKLLKELATLRSKDMEAYEKKIGELYAQSRDSVKKAFEVEDADIAAKEEKKKSDK